MDEIKQVEKAINKVEKKRKSHRKLYVISVTALLLVAGFMSLLIYGKSNPDAKVFGFNISELSKNFDSFVGNIFSPNLKEKDNDQTVGTTVKYEYLGNNFYQTEDKSVMALYDGVISSVSMQDGYYSLVVSQKNGITSQYFLLNEVMVKANDAVKQGDKIASYDEKFKATFYKGDRMIKYEEALGTVSN